MKLQNSINPKVNFVTSYTVNSMEQNWEGSNLNPSLVSHGVPYWITRIRHLSGHLYLRLQNAHRVHRKNPLRRLQPIEEAAVAASTLLLGLLDRQPPRNHLRQHGRSRVLVAQASHGGYWFPIKVTFSEQRGVKKRDEWHWVASYSVGPSILTHQSFGALHHFRGQARGAASFGGCDKKGWSVMKIRGKEKVVEPQAADSSRRYEWLKIGFLWVNIWLWYGWQ